MVTEGLLQCFPHLIGLFLEKNIPDHRPIVLLEHQVDYGPSPFRIFDSSFELDGFDIVVRNTWNSNIVVNEINNPWVTFKKKFQILKSNLRLWNSRARDRLISKRKLLQDKVKEIDTSLMLDGGSADLREQRVLAIKELTDMDHLS